MLVSVIPDRVRPLVSPDCTWNPVCAAPLCCCRHRCVCFGQFGLWGRCALGTGVRGLLHPWCVSLGQTWAWNCWSEGSPCHCLRAGQTLSTWPHLAAFLPSASSPALFLSLGHVGQNFTAISKAPVCNPAVFKVSLVSHSHSHLLRDRPRSTQK